MARLFICTIRGYEEEFPRLADSAGQARYRILLQLWEAFSKSSFSFKDIRVRISKNKENQTNG